MSHIANVKMRQLPLGDTLQRAYAVRKRVLPLGDDGGLDDISASDLDELYSGGTSFTTGFDGSFGTPDLASGFTLEPEDVDQSAINQAIDYNLQNQAIKSSNATYAATGLQPNAQPGNIPGGSSLVSALTSIGATRPLPVTSAIGTTPTPGTLLSPNNALAQSSIISGIPNYMVIAAIFGIALFAGGKK